MLTKESILKLGIECDESKARGGIDSSYLEQHDCFIIELTDENTNDRLQFDKTFAYLMLGENGEIDIEIDETLVVNEILLKDEVELKYLLYLCGINV